MSTYHNISIAEQMFRDFLASNEHPLDKEIDHDSNKFHYFSCPHGGKTDARYKFYSDGIPSGYFKCWYCGIEDDFISKQKNDVSPQEWQAHLNRLAEIKRQEERTAKKQYSDHAELARTVFSTALEANAFEHDYLLKKKVQNYGLKIVGTVNQYTEKAKCYQGTLLVPCYNANNELVNIERIYLDKKEDKYKKRPLAGAQRTGAFYMLGEVTPDKATILIAEGYSTAATIYESLGYPTVITFNCGNIPPVIQILRDIYPQSQFIIAADDDRWQKDANRRHAGENAAKKACAEFSNTTYVLPDFSVLGISEDKLAKLESPPTDFNDLFVFLVNQGLARNAALAEIARQIMPKPIPHAEILGRLINKINPVNFREQAALREGESPKNNHYQIIVVEYLLQLAKSNHWGICKHLDFVYLFNGAYWNLLDEEELKIFLGDVAEKMGVDKFKARYFNFRDHLYKQFLALARLPKPEQTKNCVRINLKNGTFEFLPDGGVLLRGFDRNDFLTYQLPFEYRSESVAPLFHAYLDRVLPEKKLQDILAEYLGYIFIPSSTLKLEKTLLLYGTGANGKSVFYEVVRNLLGEPNTSEYSLQSLTDDTGYYRAMIANKLVNYASEINGKLEASIFKQLVSGEPVEARFPYGKPFTITQYAKLIFNCNELPKDVEQTEAYFRRFLIIPFGVTIPDSEQDKQLAQKIISSELSGVFNWILEGLQRLIKQKSFTECDIIQRTREQYELESDSVKTFLFEKGYSSSPTDYVLIKSLYEEYRIFCTDDGFKPVNKTNFKRRLEASKIQTARMNIGNVAYITKISYKNFG
ncbi:toprim domain-containing protein [Legionella israelensis]|uniref:Toprim domain-containing protein n=1 Tax=Legionella israelensis TaxID=454 RepID=A0AAX1EFJ6_9GAMM|nr:phage/plasmid primase, P4 family [Legionella israelensis]QBR83843.1 toprim domain-containing protein [Legionella israelensis]